MCHVCVVALLVRAFVATPATTTAPALDPQRTKHAIHGFTCYWYYEGERIVVPAGHELYRQIISNAFRARYEMFHLGADIERDVICPKDGWYGIRDEPDDHINIDWHWEGKCELLAVVHPKRHYYTIRHHWIVKPRQLKGTGDFEHTTIAEDSQDYERRKKRRVIEAWH